MRIRFFLFFIPSFFLLSVFSGCGPEYVLKEYKKMGEYRQALLEAHRRFLNDNTPLATFTGGRFTRAAMVRYGTVTYGLESVVGSVNRPDCLLSSLRKQRQLLSEMMERRIFLKEARERGFDRTPEVRELIEYADRRLLIPIHKVRVIDRGLRFREPAVRVEHIFLRFPRTAPDIANRVPAWAASIRDQADRLRKRLLAGESFRALVGKYSQDFTRGKGGKLGWVVAGSMGPAYWKGVKNLPVGGISPVILSETGAYIVRVTGRRILTEQDFRRYLHGRFAYALSETRRKEARDRYLAGLMGRAVINTTALETGRPETVVASVGRWKLTKREYDLQFAAFSKGYKVGTFSREKLRTWKLRFLKEYLVAPRLVIQDALRLGLDRTPEYRTELKKNKRVRERIIYTEMKDHLFRTGPGDIPESRIRALYDKHKHDRYFTKKAISPSQADRYPSESIVRENGRVFVKEVRPFEAVRKTATERITRDIRYVWLDAFITKKFREAGYRLSPLSKFEVIRYTGKLP